MGLKVIFLIVSSAMSLLRLSRREAWWMDAEMLMPRHRLAVALRERPRAPARLTWPDQAWPALLAGTLPDGWTLTLAFPGDQHITNAWNGTASRNGENVTITNASCNGAIPGRRLRLRRLPGHLGHQRRCAGEFHPQRHGLLLTPGYRRPGTPSDGVPGRTSDRAPGTWRVSR